MGNRSFLTEHEVEESQNSHSSLAVVKPYADYQQLINSNSDIVHPRANQRIIMRDFVSDDQITRVRVIGKKVKVPKHKNAQKSKENEQLQKIKMIIGRKQKLSHQVFDTSKGYPTYSIQPLLDVFAASAQQLEKQQTSAVDQYLSEREGYLIGPQGREKEVQTVEVPKQNNFLSKLGNYCSSSTISREYHSFILLFAQPEFSLRDFYEAIFSHDSSSLSPFSKVSLSSTLHTMVQAIFQANQSSQYLLHDLSLEDVVFIRLSKTSRTSSSKQNPEDNLTAFWRDEFFSEVQEDKNAPIITVHQREQQKSYTSPEEIYRFQSVNEDSFHIKDDYSASAYSQSQSNDQSDASSINRRRNSLMEKESLFDSLLFKLGLMFLEVELALHHVFKVKQNYRQGSYRKFTVLQQHIIRPGSEQTKANQLLSNSIFAASRENQSKINWSFLFQSLSQVSSSIANAEEKQRIDLIKILLSRSNIERRTAKDYILKFHEKDMPNKSVQRQTLQKRNDIKDQKRKMSRNPNNFYHPIKFEESRVEPFKSTTCISQFPNRSFQNSAHHGFQKDPSQNTFESSTLNYSQSTNSSLRNQYPSVHSTQLLSRNTLFGGNINDSAFTYNSLISKPIANEAKVESHTMTSNKSIENIFKTSEFKYGGAVDGSVGWNKPVEEPRQFREGEGYWNFMSQNQNSHGSKAKINKQPPQGHFPISTSQKSTKMSDLIIPIPEPSSSGNQESFPSGEIPLKEEQMSPYTDKFKEFFQSEIRQEETSIQNGKPQMNSRLFQDQVQERSERRQTIPKQSNILIEDSDSFSKTKSKHDSLKDDDLTVMEKESIHSAVSSPKVATAFMDQLKSDTENDQEINSRSIRQPQDYQSQKQKDQKEQNSKPQYIVKQYEGGSRYEGYVIDSKRNGHGKFYYQEGSCYDGEWCDNQMHGWGRLYYSNGKLAYEGMWEKDEFHGQGKVINDNPTMLDDSFDYTNFNNLEEQWLYYEGNLRHDSKQGRGLIMLENGEHFEGNFENDKINGKGQFHNISGQVIRGVWKDSILVQLQSQD